MTQSEYIAEIPAKRYKNTNDMTYLHCLYSNILFLTVTYITSIMLSGLHYSPYITGISFILQILMLIKIENCSKVIFRIFRKKYD